MAQWPGRDWLLGRSGDEGRDEDDDGLISRALRPPHYAAVRLTQIEGNASVQLRPSCFEIQVASRECRRLLL